MRTRLQGCAWCRCMTDCGACAIVRRHEAFLEQVATFARAMWTQFHAPSMVGGLALILLAVAMQAAVLRAGHAGSVPQLAMLAAHGLSLFSNSYILEEGRVLVFFATSSFLFGTVVRVRRKGLPYIMCVCTRHVSNMPQKATHKTNHLAWLALALLCSVQVQRGLPTRTGDDAVPGFGAAAYREEGPPTHTMHHRSVLLAPAASAALALLVVAWGRLLFRQASTGPGTTAWGMHLAWALQLTAWAAVIVDALPTYMAVWWAPHWPARVRVDCCSQPYQTISTGGTACVDGHGCHRPAASRHKACQYHPIQLVGGAFSAWCILCGDVGPRGPRFPAVCSAAVAVRASAWVDPLVPVLVARAAILCHWALLRIRWAAVCSWCVGSAG